MKSVHSTVGVPVWSGMKLDCTLMMPLAVCGYSDRELYLLYASGMEILEACDSNWVNNLSNKLMHVLFYYGEPKSHLQDEHVL